VRAAFKLTLANSFTICPCKFLLVNGFDELHNTLLFRFDKSPFHVTCGPGFSFFPAVPRATLHLPRAAFLITLSTFNSEVLNSHPKSFGLQVQ